MTLTELRDRLTAIIEQNPGRAHLPVAVELPSYGPLRRNGRRSYRHEFRPIESASAVQYGVNGDQYMTITAEAVIMPEKTKAAFGVEALR